MQRPRDFSVSRLRDHVASLCDRHGDEKAVIGGQRLTGWTDGVFTIVRMLPASPIQAAPKWCALDIYERGARRLSLHWLDGATPTCAFIERSEVWMPRFLDATMGV